MSFTTIVGKRRFFLALATCTTLMWAHHATAAGLTELGLTARAGVSSSGVTPFLEETFWGVTYTHTVLAAPANGSASVFGNKFFYVPNPGFTGADQFPYRITDDSGHSYDGSARVRVYGGNALARCTSASVNNGDGTARRTSSAQCALNGGVVTRKTLAGDAVTVQYLVHRPSSGAAPKAVVYLIAGGDLDANITLDDATGLPSGTGGNFLVRTAQMFAEAGYLAIAMHRPDDQPSPGSADSNTDVDRYRISVNHPVDILTVLRHVNTDGLDVFLAGTSRGAMSVVPHNMIAAGISISSPVTRGSGSFPDRVFVNDPRHPNLQPSFVQRPTHVLWHQNDACGITRPVDSQRLVNDLIAAGVATASNTVSGGFNVTNPEFDPCGGQALHGYLGIEPTAVGHITSWLDGRMALLAGNRRPEAWFATIATAPGVATNVDLTSLTADSDGDALAYSLASAATVRGGSVVLDGALLTYTPPAGLGNEQEDYLVYAVTDGRGGVNAAVITIQIAGGG